MYRPTLTGQGEKCHLASPEVELETHIQDVVNAIVWEKLDNVVLVGHSYGGIVVTGAADRVCGSDQAARLPGRDRAQRTVSALTTFWGR